METEVALKIVHCKKKPFDQYIGRPSRYSNIWGFGNPFVIGIDGDRSTVITKFDSWLDTGENYGNNDATEDRRSWILSNLRNLTGKTLGCFCNFPEQDCHGRILLERAHKQLN